MKNSLTKKIEIIFENKFLLIANKPSATLSVPTRLGVHEKRPILKALLEAQLKCPLWSVHRLDYEVSGLIIYAKLADVHRAANAWFEKQIVHKTYSAICEGDPTLAAQFTALTEWRSYIVRGKKRAFEAPYGQEAITLAKFIQKTSAGLQWELQPRTGRGHQLRYEMAKHGFPILGDVLYGAKTENADESIALSSVAIDFDLCPERELFELPTVVSLPVA